jgi:UDPglucose 6-dehydrogenase
MVSVVIAARRYKMRRITAAVVGCGIIGGAVSKYLINFADAKVHIYDPPKGYERDPLKTDIAFVCVPAETKEDGSVDLSIIYRTLDMFNLGHYKNPIVIRSTIPPGTMSQLAHDYIHLDLSHMPEFLTSRRALLDIVTQKIIFGQLQGEGRSTAVSLLLKLFPNHEFSLVTPTEAEICKYTHNIFGALKVTYCNIIYELAQKSHSDYNKIRDAVAPFNLLRKHTDVPGPDGRRGYGGHCFVKDTKAFMKLLDDQGVPSSTLRGMMADNEWYRSDICFKVPEGV